MAVETIKASATGQGPGTVPFTIGANGKLAMASDSAPAAAPDQPATTAPADTAPADTAPAPTPTAFERMFPGVDPGKVEMYTDERTGKIKFKMMPEAPVEETQDQAPTPAAPTPTPTTPAGLDVEVATLRAEMARKDDLMAAMAQAMMSGKSLNEVLGLAPTSEPEPDYSQYDLYDDAQRASFVKQIRQDALASARAEVQAAMQPHQAALASARQQSEYNAVKAKNGADPDFERKAALATELIQGNPNVSFAATYNLVSTVQKSLGVAGAPLVGATQQAKQTTLTPEQAAAKAEQAARPQSNGVRGAGKPTPPEAILKDFKKLAAWVAQQQALGNLT